MTLQKQPAPAAQSINLDYVSPFMPITLWLAIRNKHWLIVCTMVGNLLWLLMIVFAAGLFLETDVQMDNEIVLVASDRFDGAVFQERSGFDSRMVYTILAVKHEQFGLRFPPGTTAEYAVQSFKPRDNELLNRTLTGTVDVFVGGLECEVGRSNSTPEFVSFCFSNSPSLPGALLLCSSGPGYLINVTTPTCELVNITVPAQQSELNDKAPNDQYYGSVQLVRCSKNKSDDHQHRLLVTLLLSRELRNNAPWIKGGEPIGPPDLSLLRFSHVLCRPTYRIRRGLVITGGIADGEFGNSITVKLEEGDSPGRTLEGVSEDDFTTRFANSMSAADQIESFFLKNKTIHLAGSIQLAMLYRPNLTIDEMFEPGVLELTFRDIYRGLSAQFAKKILMSPTAEEVLGVTTFLQSRLVVRRVSFGGMQALFLIFYIMLANLLFHLPRWSMPLDPGSIGFIAILLKGSTGLLARLEGLGHLGRREFEKHLGSNHLYRIPATKGPQTFSFKIEEIGEGAEAPRSDEPLSHEPPSPQDTTIRRWTAYPMKRWGICLFVGGPLLLIAGLEVSFWQFDTNDVLHGILPAQSVTYVWAYLPVAIMVGVSLLLGAFNLIVITTKPYHALHKGRASARDSIQMNYVTRPSLVALALALRRGHRSVVAASLMAIIGAFLGIIAGGLFSVSRVPLRLDLEFEAADRFMAAPFNELENTIPGISAHLIIQNNLTYPDGTYGDLVLPRFSIPELLATGQVADNATTLELKMPVLQPQLSCIPLPSAQIRMDRETTENGTVFGPDMDIPFPSCVPPNPFGIDDFPGLLYTVGPIPPNEYFGGVASFGRAAENCSNFFVVFGKVQGDVVDDVSAITCTGWVTEVVAGAPFIFTGEKVNLSGPPTIETHTAKNFSQRSMSYLHHLFAAVDVAPNGASASLDPFLQAAIYGKTGVPPEQLLGKNGSDTSRLASRVRDLYAVVAAQYIDQTWRQTIDPRSLTASNPLPSFRGSITYPNRVWLRQSSIETRLLDALLGVISLCAIGVYCMVRPCRVLPKNPHAIASVGSLLAGSALIRQLQEEATPARNEKTMGKRGGSHVISGNTFSLKWWRDENSDVQRFGVDIDPGEESG
jgi:hypothetical protein